VGCERQNLSEMLVNYLLNSCAYLKNAVSCLKTYNKLYPKSRNVEDVITSF